MRDYLLFQLWGPMQAWGGVAVGEVRGSERFPGKAAVLGLVAGALGIRRDEEDLLTNMGRAYGFCARADHPGSPLRDYHTVQAPHPRKTPYLTRRSEVVDAGKLHTVLSSRDYLVEAAFTVCLWAVDHAPPIPLEDMRQALLRPRFAPYLGRKCCPPGLPFRPRIERRGDLSEALAAYAPDRDFLGSVVAEPGRRVDVVWEGEADFQERWSLPRRDVLVSARRRLFAERTQREGMTTLP